MSSQKEGKPDHVIDIDHLLPFQTLNIDINNLGEEPLKHYFKFLNQQEKEALTGQFEELMVKHIAKNYSIKEQEMMEKNVKASAKADYELAIGELENNLNRRLLSGWEKMVPKPLLKGLAKRLGVDETKDIVEGLRQFFLQKQKLIIRLCDRNSTDTKQFPMNVMRYQAKSYGIKFDESTSYDDLFQAIKNIWGEGRSGVTEATGPTGPVGW